jgi:hypothetical protein
VSFFLDNALRAVKRGFSIIPCDIRDKGPYGLNARTKALNEARAELKRRDGSGARLSRDEQARLRKMYPIKGIYSRTNTVSGVELFASEVCPDANYGICSDENSIIFETDDRKRLTELLPQPLPRTLTISARPNRGYFIFKQTDRSRAIDGILEVPGLFELRNKGYCVGWGSIHPETQKEYRLVTDVEPVPIPDWLIDALYEIRKSAPSSGATGAAGAGDVDTDALKTLLDALHKRGEPKDMLGISNLAITSLHPTLKALGAHLYKGTDSSDEVIEILWAVGNEYRTDREPAEKDIDDVVHYMDRNNFEPCFCKQCYDAVEFNAPSFSYSDKGELWIFATGAEYDAFVAARLLEKHKNELGKEVPTDLIFSKPKQPYTNNEFVLNPLPGRMEGWFPLGDISLSGGPSGVGKTRLMWKIFPAQRRCESVFGHTTNGYDYLVLMADRGRRDNERTLSSMGMDPHEAPIAFLPLSHGLAAAQANRQRDRTSACIAAHRFR